jgi:hypothetical protein
MTTLEDDLRAALRAESEVLRVPERPALDAAVDAPGGAPGTRWLVAAACLALVAGGTLVLAERDGHREPTPPVASTPSGSTVPTTGVSPGSDTTIPADDTKVPPIEITSPTAATNGFLAVADVGGDESDGLSLIVPGDDSVRIRVPGSESVEEPCPAWSPGGERLMFGRVTSSTPGELGDRTTFSDAEAVIVPVDDGAIGPERVVPLEGFGAHVCGLWAPDGRWAAFTDPSGVWVVDTETGEIRRLPDLRPVDLEWRPGTDQLAIAGELGTTSEASPVSVYSVSTGELEQLGSVAAAEITWSPDGSRLAYRGGEADSSGLWLVDGDGTDRRLLVADTGEHLHGVGPVWSPAGDRLVYQRLCCGGERHEVVLVDVADGTETATQLVADDGTPWWPSEVTWSPDGAMLVGGAWPDGGASRLFVMPADSPADVTVFADSSATTGYENLHGWAVLQAWGAEPVEKATVRLADDVPVTFTVPAGWSTSVDDSVLRGDPMFGVMFGGEVTRIYTDSCPSSMIDPPPGPTVDDFASTWAGLPGFEATAPVDITVDGFLGKLVEFTVPDYDEGECPYGDFMLMGVAGGDGYWAQAPNGHHRLLILDVDGRRIVIVAFWYPDTSEADRAAIDRILASIRIG